MTGRVLRVPGDKSISHRALLLAALADGESRIDGVLTGADVQSTATALRALGCAVPPLAVDQTLRIHGLGLNGMHAPADTIHCGNSGTTARLLLGILAGQPIAATMTGDASLRARPMRRVTGPLGRMGAGFDELGEPDRLPLRVRGGRLVPLDYASPHASAQVKSALLLAGVTGGARVVVTEPHLSRDHTERMLRAQGVNLDAFVADGRPGVAITPPARLEPLDVRVPGDFSSAAFFLALGALTVATPLRIAGVGVNPTRTGLLRVLERMGVHVERTAERLEGGEPVADLTVQRASLRGTTIEPDEVPALIDELPVVAVLGARAEGTTIVRGAGELRLKETDRIRALVGNLRALGVEALESDDGMTVTGTDTPLRGRVRACGDHRIAMAFGVLGAEARSAIEIDDPSVVGISFPDFWAQLRAHAG